MPESDPRNSLLLSPRARAAALGLLLLLGLAVRIDGIWQPPIDFHPTRQLRAAMIARDMAISWGMIDADPAAQAAAVASRGYFPVLEPPVLEMAAALAYGALGAEHLWFPRALSALLWVAGAFVLHRWLRSMGAGDGALVGLGAFLLMPFAVAASRSFQPDPLMVALSVCAVALFHAAATRDAGKFAFACLVGGVAALVKPPAIFACAAAALWSCAALRDRPGRGLRVVALVLLAAIPAAYYGALMATSPSFGEQAESSLRPALWLAPSFWQGWVQKVLLAAGMPALLIAAAGIALAPRRERGLLLALAAGYVAYGLAFAYHIHTHDYYQLPLMPLLAAGIAFAARPVAERLASALDTGFARAAFAAAVCGAMAVAAGAQHYRNAIGIATKPAHWDFDGEVERARRIGDIVGHSTRTLILAADYGASLRYYGRIGGRTWPTTDHARAMADGRTFDELWREMAAPDAPEFFIATDLADLREQRELRAWLDEHGRPLEKAGQFVVYDLRAE